MAPRKKKEIEEKPELVKPPIKNLFVAGHSHQLAEMERDFNSGKPAQSWLITGTRGIGKATCVYNIARRLLAVTSRDMPLLDKVSDAFSHRIGEGGHTDLKIIEAEDGKDIPVEEIRNLQHFMHLTAGESAWRVVVIDGAESMNASSANALLKLLEEPPAGAIIFLISHAFGRLLPTIKSRCRKIAFMPVAAADFAVVLKNSDLEISADKIPALYAISHGSPGLAIKLYLAGVLELYSEIMAILEHYPNMPVPLQIRWAEKVASKQKPENWEAARQIFMHIAHRLAMAAYSDGTDTQLYRRIAATRPLDYWHSLWETMGALLADNAVLHFDARQVALEFFHKLKAA